MKTIFLCLIFLSSLYSTFGQIGELDPSFGNKGIVISDIGSRYSYNYEHQQVLYQSDGSIFFILEVDGQVVINKRHANGFLDINYGRNGSSVSLPMKIPHALLQPDGKIIITGITINLFGGFFAVEAPFSIEVARFDIDGSLDTAFGVKGVQISRFNYCNVAQSIALQADGKIVVAGYVAVNTPPQYLLIARYNSNGSLDSSFGNEGKQTFGYNDNGRALAIQSDGKIIVGGSKLFRFNSGGSIDSTFNGNGEEDISGIDDIAIQNDGKIIIRRDSGFSLYRVKLNGGLDSAFGINGLLSLDFGGTQDKSNSLGIQGDGKIVMAGKSETSSSSSFAIARFNQDGTLDKKQVTAIGTNSFANSLAFQNDGKLITFGINVEGNKTNFAAARYNLNSSLDPSFGTNGILIDKILQGSTFYTCTAIQIDGKILSAGYTWNGQNYDFALIRYNKDGTVDSTFSKGGIQLTDFGGTDDKATGIAIQGDGKIILAGMAGNKFGISRYNTNGSLDITFDGDGLQTTSFGGVDFATSASIQNDGKILVAGSGLARYNINGTLDLTFGINGKISTPFICNNVHIQADGKIIIQGNNIYCSVARFNTYGTPDTTFGINGMRVLEFTHNTNPTLHGNSLGFQSDGKIIIGGYLETKQKDLTSSQFGVLRLNTDGSDDNNFFTGWPILSSVNNHDYATSLIIQSDNKILLGGYYNNDNNEDFTITRYNSNGSLDNTFNGDGKQITQVGLANDRIAALAISESKLYAVGYGQFPGSLGIIARYLLGPEAGPLPVSLLNFTAGIENQSVILKWQTSSENNLSHFIIQRSTTIQDFKSIGYLSANGNTNFSINYKSVDYNPLQGLNFYRLKMVDIGGKFSFSKIVSITIKNDFTFRISPNPPKDVLHVNINGLHENVAIQIIDVNGNKVKEIKVLLSGDDLISLDIHNLSSGIYNIKLYAAIKTEVIKFIKK